MSEDAPQEDSPAGFNKIDLSQLQGFSFGTQWTQDKAQPSGPGDGRRSGRDDRRDDGGPGGKRDRRSFRRPDRPAESAGGPGAADEAGRSERRFRRDGAPGGARRGDGFGRPPPREEAPYDSPVFSVTFYPEDTSFNALVKTVRASCRTIELFEIARTVLGKPERFTLLLARKPAGAPAARNAPAEPARDGGEPRPAASAPEASRLPVYLSAPDGFPFETEEAAIAHVLSRHLGRFFDQTEVEVDPPKGNFQVVNRCPLTGELLAPPNYHRYNQILVQHHAARIRNVPLEVYRSRVESVRDPALVQQWLDRMKRVTRYTWKKPAPKAAPRLEDAQPQSSSGDAVPSAAAVEAVVAEVQAAAPAEPALSFDSLEDARQHLLTHARDRVVRTAATARLHGREVAELPPGEARRAVEGAWERQKRFPLDTANALRGRLRRERFTIFKKGSKGISYVCAVKRKFRVPGQVLAQSIDSLISFIENHPMVKAGDLPKAFLGVSLPEAAPAAPEAAAAPPPAPTPEEREKLSRLHADLLWLVREGYVTEFIDGTLYAPPPMAEARKREVEAEENDPEGFPDAPPAAAGESAPLAAAPEAAAEPVASDPASAPAPEAAPAEPPPPPSA